MKTLSSRFKTSLACLAGTLLALSVQAQSGDLLPGAGGFTRADTLRGTLTPERTWWDLRHYHLQVRVNPTDSTISGRNDIGTRC